MINLANLIAKNNILQEELKINKRISDSKINSLSSEVDDLTEALGSMVEDTYQSDLTLIEG